MGIDRAATVTVGGALVFAGLLAALGLPLDGAAGQADPRVAGEYSLVVTEEEGQLVVRWLTEEQVPGVFEARVEGRTIHRDTTEVGMRHAVRFAVPAADRVQLRYGPAGAASLHETTIRQGVGPSRDDRSVFEAPDSLWVVGDVHGEFSRLRRLLRRGGLVDEDGSWTGGESHLVLLGDLMDRGPYVTGLLWFVYRLQEEARRAGGRVHVVLGNHEAMVLTGDHRYVSSHERLLARRHGLTYGEMYHPRSSVLGRWLTARPAVLKIGRVLLAHGGVGPEYLDRSVRELNDSLAVYVSEDLFEYWSDTTVAVTPRDSAAVARRVQFFFREPSVLWYRGYAQHDTLGDRLRELLERHDADLHVIGHTAVPEIRQTYGDSLVLVDLQRPASEMLLLVRHGDGYCRRAVGTEGPPRRLGEPGGSR